MIDEILKNISGSADKDKFYNVISDFTHIPESRIIELKKKKKELKLEIESAYEDISVIKDRISDLKDILRNLNNNKEQNIFLYIYKYFTLVELYRLNQEVLDLSPNDKVKEKTRISNIIEINEVKRKIFDLSQFGEDYGSRIKCEKETE